MANKLVDDNNECNDLKKTTYVTNKHLIAESVKWLKQSDTATDS